MSEFQAQEDINGLRFSWNIFPNSRLDATRCVVPVGCLFTPLKSLKDRKPLNYAPVTCRKCYSVLNPYSVVDFASKSWTCNFCSQRNQLPPGYNDISQTNLPAELLPQYSTIEYKLPRANAPIPAFLFVVDICTEETELANLTNTLTQALSILPQETQVGLITCGTNVHVYDLSETEFKKSIVLRGSKKYTTAQIQELLGLQAQRVMPQNQNQNQQTQYRGNISRFLQPINESEFCISSILEELKPDGFTVEPGNRPLRSIGTALSTAITLLSCRYGSGRVIFFGSGPATNGPGAIVDVDKKKPIRFHHDIFQSTSNSIYVKEAFNYYTELAEIAHKHGIAVDLFSCSLDQIGIHEMRNLSKKTGGLILVTDKFDTDMFRDSFRKLISQAIVLTNDSLEKTDNTSSKNPILLSFDATIDVYTSRELKVAGAIGNCESLKKKSPFVSNMKIGTADTSAWRVCGIDSASTLAFYFEVVNLHNSPVPPDRIGSIQFLTTYHTFSGEWIMRVTTSPHRFASLESQIDNIILGFDQEAAAVLMARYAIFKSDTELPQTIIRWLDKTLIQLFSKFANYQKNQPDSLSISPKFSIYPQFMFHFRRSNLLKVFNNSPDETAFFRHYLLRENTFHSILIIQPMLQSYPLDKSPSPVPLDSSSIQKNVVLLFDSFFLVLVFHGKDIAAWIKQNFHEQPEYQSFKLFLEIPKGDANVLMENRFPRPRYVVCNQGDSQSRFLLSRCNPSKTHSNSQNQIMQSHQNPQENQVILTDDASFQYFYNFLKRLVVQG